MDKTRLLPVRACAVASAQPACTMAANKCCSVCVYNTASPKAAEVYIAWRKRDVYCALLQMALLAT
jgi:hypothetical protein